MTVRRAILGAAALIGLTLAAGPGAAASRAWIASWAASPAPPQAARPGVRPDLATPLLTDQTVVQIVRLSAGGQALRVRFTNEYGQAPLEIRAARISVLDADGHPGASQALTFGGAPAVSVPTKAPMLSDPVALPTHSLSRLRIALYVGGKPLCTCHIFGLQPPEVSPPGDFTDRPFTSVAPPAAGWRAFLSQVEVETTPRPVIVALGDSITDGFASTPGADHRWPDRLAERLAAASRTPPAVVNAGIGGNRILSEATLAVLGENVLSRLDRDALSVPGVTHIVLLEGINDIGGGGASPPSAESLILGYRQIIARAHARGVKVIGATLTPFQGPKPIYYGPAGEPVRQQLNDWIRHGGAFDGVIDFDAAVRDPKAPRQMRADLQSGDWLHPNDAGYAAMGDSIDLSLFH